MPTESDTNQIVNRAVPLKHIETTNSRELILPSGEKVIVTEWTDESGNMDSYGIRLYLKANENSSLRRFSNGQIRPCKGNIEDVALQDLDQDGDAEIIVISRNKETKSLTADAYCVTGAYLNFLTALSDLPATANPTLQLVKLVKEKSAHPHQTTGKKCKKIIELHGKKLPKKGHEVSLKQIKNICINYGETDLLAKIEQDPPTKPFQSDGCSLWFGSWKGVSLYPACFFHDLKYWAGYPDEDTERLIADAELMIDIACLTGSTVMAETMFQGTRLGGNEMYQRSFSWGFGRERD